MIVAVSAAHRDEAFAGAREAIDRIKAEAPIWKREPTADGDRELGRRRGAGARRAERRTAHPRRRRRTRAHGRRRRQAGERAAWPAPGHACACRRAAPAPSGRRRARRARCSATARIAGIQAAKQTGPADPARPPAGAHVRRRQACVDVERGPGRAGQRGPYRRPHRRRDGGDDRRARSPRSPSTTWSRGSSAASRSSRSCCSRSVAGAAATTAARSAEHGRARGGCSRSAPPGPPARARTRAARSSSSSPERLGARDRRSEMIVPDDRARSKRACATGPTTAGCELVLTSGGTGLSRRRRHPGGDAGRDRAGGTRDRRGDAPRARSRTHPHWMLSRAHRRRSRLDADRQLPRQPAEHRAGRRGDRRRRSPHALALIAGGAPPTESRAVTQRLIQRDEHDRATASAEGSAVRPPPARLPSAFDNESSQRAEYGGLVRAHAFGEKYRLGDDLEFPPSPSRSCWSRSRSRRWGASVLRIARVAKEALIRRGEIRRELSGDWCARLGKRELRAFAGSQG